MNCEGDSIQNEDQFPANKNAISGYVDLLPSSASWIKCRCRITDLQDVYSFRNIYFHFELSDLVCYRPLWSCRLLLAVQPTRQRPWIIMAVVTTENKNVTQSVGLEPTLPEGNWFLVSRLNHSATTAATITNDTFPRKKWQADSRLRCTDDCEVQGAQKNTPVGSVWQAR